MKRPTNMRYSHRLDIGQPLLVTSLVAMIFSPYTSIRALILQGRSPLLHPPCLLDAPRHHLLTCAPTRRNQGPCAGLPCRHNLTSRATPPWAGDSPCSSTPSLPIGRCEPHEPSY